MKTELYRAIKEIDIKNLAEDDKEELLGIFMVTKNDLIRNQIAFMLSDLHYEKAVPFIFKKIDEIPHNNGSLVFSLQGFKVKEYFIQLIKIICEHEYEPRLMAYGIVEDLVPEISAAVKSEALTILEAHRIALEETAIDKGEDSTLHFVEQTQQLLS